MDSIELDFKLYSSSLEVQGLGAITGRFLEVYLGLILKQCTIFDEKRDIRPEENLLLLKLT